MPRRRFDIPRAKRWVMAVSGLVLGLWSAVSGIAAQAAAGPYITFMLGFQSPKAAATAALFAFWTCAGTLGAWVAAHAAPIPLSLALLVSIGAVLGVLLCSPLATAGVSLRRVGQGLVVMGMLYFTAEGIRAPFGGPALLPWELLRTWPGWLVLGAASGALAHFLMLPSGIILVPALVHGAGLSPGVALVTSLTVAVIASILPLASYVAQGVTDRTVGPAMNLGGAIGGAMGGWLLARVATPESTWPLVTFGITAMCLSAWLAYRSA